MVDDALRAMSSEFDRRYAGSAGIDSALSDSYQHDRLLCEPYNSTPPERPRRPEGGATPTS
jgi:hypothetical protein